MEKTISQKIIDLRRAAGLTQEQLGERLGISGQAVSKWERGESMPDILLLPDLCDALGTNLDSLLDARRVNNPRVVSDFCEYAVKNGRAKTVQQAISRLMNRNVVAPQNDTLSVCLENGKNILVSDPLGMGFVMSGTEFADYCLDMSGERINNPVRLFTDKNTLAVIKIIAKKTSTINEISEETGLDIAQVQEILLTLINSTVISYTCDKDGKVGYCPASGIVAVWMVLAGCSLFDLEGVGDVRGNSWVTV